MNRPQNFYFSKGWIRIQAIWRPDPPLWPPVGSIQLSGMQSRAEEKLANPTPACNTPGEAEIFANCRLNTNHFLKNQEPNLTLKKDPDPTLEKQPGS